MKIIKKTINPTIPTGKHSVGIGLGVTIKNVTNINTCVKTNKLALSNLDMINTFFYLTSNSAISNS